MKKSVVYLTSGPAHLPYLAASLSTLRQHYSGEIQIHSWPESFELASRLAADPRINATCTEREPKLRRRDGVKGNSQFLDKIDLMGSLDPGLNLYLDADTTVHGSLDPLFNLADRHGFAATQFNNWVTNSGMPHKRVSRLRGVAGIGQHSVEQVLAKEFPSLNGGVFCCQPDTPVLKTWYDWTMCVKQMFIADEVVLHTMMAEYAIGVALGGNYNCAPKYQPEYLEDDKVVVYHYHGDSNVRPSKCPKGIYLWWKHYLDCVSSNIGGIADWKDSVGNKYLPKLEATPTSHCLYCQVNTHANEEHASKCPESISPIGS